MCNSNKRLTSKLVFSALISAAFLQTAYAADYYQVIDLGAFEQGRSEAFAISESGDVVGNAFNEDLSDHAFINRDDEIFSLGFLTGDVETDGKSLAFGVNNNYAVGYSEESNIDPNDAEQTITTEFAVFYDTVNFTINKIPQFDENNLKNARAENINSNNLVVGFGRFNPPDDFNDDGDPLEIDYERGFFFDIDTDSILTIVESSESDDRLFLRDVNDSGLATGVKAKQLPSLNFFPPSQVVVVNVSSPNIVEEIDIFGGLIQQPWAINNNGLIVGRARDEDNEVQAFMVDAVSKEVTGLGFLNENFKLSEAYDINDIGQVVGVSQYQNNPFIAHAFLYEDGEMKDLDKMIGCDTGWRLHEARSINNDGVIAGTGIFNGDRRAFKLIPIENSVAPNCEDTDTGSTSSSSGPISILSLLSVFGLAIFRRKIKR